MHNDDLREVFEFDSVVAFVNHMAYEALLRSLKERGDITDYVITDYVMTGPNAATVTILAPVRSMIVTLQAGSQVRVRETLVRATEEGYKEL